MKHILFISYDGLTDPLGPSQIIPYLAGLSNFGYRFTILSFEKKQPFAEKKILVDKLLEGYPINWIPLWYHKNPPVISSLIDYQALKKEAVSIFKRDPYQMVHTRPGLPELAASGIKKKFGVKFFNDVRGFWADERVDGGMWNRKNPLFNFVYLFFKRNEKQALINADGINCLTHAARNEMLSWPFLNGREISMVSCAADLHLFDPGRFTTEQKAVIRKSLGIHPDDRVFCYLGSIGGWYLTSEMMRLCKKINNLVPNARFLFISPHRHDVIVEAASKELVPADKIVTVRANRNQVPEFLSIVDFALFFIKPCYSKISSSPTKHGELMAMGIPVITNTGVGDVAEIVRESNSGILLEKFDEPELNQAVQEILTRPFNRESIRQAAFTYYSLDKAVQAYRKAYDKLLG